MTELSRRAHACTQGRQVRYVASNLQPLGYEIFRVMRDEFIKAHLEVGCCACAARQVQAWYGQCRYSHPQGMAGSGAARVGKGIEADVDQVEQGKVVVGVGARMKAQPVGADALPGKPGTQSVTDVGVGHGRKQHLGGGQGAQQLRPAGDHFRA